MESDTERSLELAIQFHETYERLAPEFGYATREDTREFDPESANGKLMIAVCAELITTTLNGVKVMMSDAEIIQYNKLRTRLNSKPRINRSDVFNMDLDF